MSELKGRLDRVADGFEPGADGFDRTLRRARRRERRRRFVAACLALVLSTGATAFALHAFRTSDAAVPMGKGATCGGLPATEIGTSGDDRFEGTPGDDVVVSNGGHDLVTVTAGRDLICRRSGGRATISRWADLPSPLRIGGHMFAVIPDVVHQPVDLAGFTLRQAGTCLRNVRINGGPDDHGGSLIVTNQDPVPGTAVPVWSDVAVESTPGHVDEHQIQKITNPNGGPPEDPTCPPDQPARSSPPVMPVHPVTVPDVAGMSIKDAEDTLDSAGFGVDYADVAPNREAGANSVIAQDPVAGAQAESGSVVLLVIAHPAFTPSPVLRLSCAGGKTQVLTPLVEAQPDGLHVLVVLGSGDAGYVDVSSPTVEPQSQWSSGDSGIDDEFVRPVPPGEDLAYCGADDAINRQDEIAASASFHLVSPTFVPYQPECSDPATAGDTSGGPSDPDAEGFIRASYPGIRASDTVERAGYLEGAMGDLRPWWRVTRDGQVVAALLISRFRDGWITLEARACRESGIQLH